MKRFAIIVLLVIGSAVAARATVIAPTAWTSYNSMEATGALNYNFPMGLWVAGSDWPEPYISRFTATGMFDTSGMATGSYFFNVVIFDFHLPNGYDEPQDPTILRMMQVSSFIDDGVVDDSDFGKGTPFVRVGFPQVRGATFSFDVSAVVNSAIANADRYVTFSFTPAWDITADRTTFTFGTPTNPSLNRTQPLFPTLLNSVASVESSTPASVLSYTTLGDKEFADTVTAPMTPEPTSVALMAVGAVVLFQRRKRITQ